MDEEKKIIKRIDKIDRAMAQEGMSLTEEEKVIIADIYQGKKTYKEARREIIEKYQNPVNEPVFTGFEEPVQNPTNESTMKHGR